SAIPSPKTTIYFMFFYLLLCSDTDPAQDFRTSSRFLVKRSLTHHFCDKSKLIVQSRNRNKLCFSKKHFYFFFVFLKISLYSHKEFMFYIFNINLIQNLAAPISHYRLALVFSAVHHISHYSAGRRQFACTAAVEHRISEYISMAKNGVKYAVYTVKRTVLSHQFRTHHRIEFLALSLTGSQQLHLHSQKAGIFHILSSDFCNSLGINALIIYMSSIGQRRKNGDLPAGVKSFHVCLRIPLCITFFLSFF